MTHARLGLLWERWARWPGLPFLTAFAFYLITLAPTLLWGDAAEFQRRAYTLELGAGITDHPLYLVWAHLFTRLSLGDVAWRVNFCSAVGASAGIGIVHHLLRSLNASSRAAWIGAGALTVSQAYWTHGVRAEVYSTYTALFALFLLAGVRWLHTRRAGWLALASVVLSLSLSVHVLALTAVLGLFALYIHARDARQIYSGLAALIVGALPLTLFLLLANGNNLGWQLWQTIQISPTPTRWPADALFLAGFLLYQFPLAILLSPWGIRRLWRESRPMLAFLGLTWLGNVFAVFDLQVPDRHVFYLPAFVVTALLIGLGVDGLAVRLKPRALLEAACIALPAIIYTTLPVGLNAARLNPFDFRDLPYRNGNLFHLLPATTGYAGPRLFGEDVLGSLPAHSVVLADHTIRQNLLYLQAVESRRPDVEVVEIYGGKGQQLPYLQRVSGDRPAFVGAIDRYLDRDEILTEFELVPFGLIYRAIPRGGVDAGSN